MPNLLLQPTDKLLKDLCNSAFKPVQRNLANIIGMNYKKVLWPLKRRSNIFSG